MNNKVVAVQVTPLRLARWKAPYRYTQSEIVSLDRFARIARSTSTPKR
ncbi:hypothetical protein [Stenotrophomonas tumulicola]|uniref:Uncharacterized protein n=1 Tax=Stenotrophomonas tumulicola TaxID=1685415 RepID=A0A7W3FLU4_9GAMM|nr:hypothetical protein [Stenotrophomonas tumulicola]MBA8681909.1 hypothetical protein [Stenotrophomonas tumulicola]